MESPNCTRHMLIPSSSDYLADLSTGFLVVTILLGVAAAADVVLYFEQIAFFLIHRKDWKPKDKAKWIIAVYPIMSATSFGALLVPRSSYIADTVTSIYVSLIVYMFLTMLIGHYGGLDRMVSKLAGSMMKFNTQPCCCCCCCLPEKPINWRLLRNIQIIVLQFALVRPILAYVITVVYTDQHFGPETVAASPSTWLAVINSLSSITAMWGLTMIFKVSRIPLQHVSLKPKFICVQLVIMIGGLQKAIISIFVVTNVIPCDGLLSRQANGDRWNHMIIIIEALILSVVARHYYRKHVGDNPYYPAEEATFVTTERLLSTQENYGSGDSFGNSSSYATEDSRGQNDVGRVPHFHGGSPHTMSASNRQTLLETNSSQRNYAEGKAKEVPAHECSVAGKTNEMEGRNEEDTDALLLDFDDQSSTA